MSHDGDRDRIKLLRSGSGAERLTVAAVIPGKSRSRPTFLFSSVLTWNFAVVLALHTVSQLTEKEMMETQI